MPPPSITSIGTKTSRPARVPVINSRLTQRWAPDSFQIDMRTSTVSRSSMLGPERSRVRPSMRYAGPNLERVLGKRNRPHRMPQDRSGGAEGH